jgi:SAM-dependent methyltransferase
MIKKLTKIKVNRKKIDSFWKKRTKIKDARIATHFKYDDTHNYDLKLIDKYITPKSKVLDLGCGPCYITNKLIGKARYIKGVDKFGEFLKHCKTGPNFKIEQSDLLKYKDKNKYDLILLIGVMFCFGDKESEKIYKNCFNLLTKSGTMIIRQQYGVKKDVIIDKYSQQIGDNYYTYYRFLQKELKILKSFFKVKVIDVLPKRLNPWSNTHHYALICKKR